MCVCVWHAEESTVFSLASSEKQRTAMLDLRVFFSLADMLEDWKAAVIKESVNEVRAREE